MALIVNDFGMDIGFSGALQPKGIRAIANDPNYIDIELTFSL
jgi:hypothetical protein